MADLYISPSHVDGSSVSLMEALACGLPCLVSDIPANQEWVREGENGWLFPDGDDERLAGKILAAVQAAAGIRRALAALNALLKVEGLPEMRVRVGVHTGPVLAGSVGTPERWEFGVVGDTVNCAARIEGLQRNDAPSPSCRVLLSGTTLALVRETIQGPWNFWGTLPLSGRSGAVEVWELLEEDVADGAMEDSGASSSQRTGS